MPTLFVNSSDSVYQSKGIFACAVEEELFYVNGTKSAPLETTCLSTAVWKSQESLQCWKGKKKVNVR